MVCQFLLKLKIDESRVYGATCVQVSLILSLINVQGIIYLCKILDVLSVVNLRESTQP